MKLLSISCCLVPHTHSNILLCFSALRASDNGNKHPVSQICSSVECCSSLLWLLLMTVSWCSISNVFASCYDRICVYIWSLWPPADIPVFCLSLPVPSLLQTHDSLLMSSRSAPGLLSGVFPCSQLRTRIRHNLHKAHLETGMSMCR